MLNDRFILTAAHCFWFDGTEANEIEVVSHAWNLDMTKKVILTYELSLLQKSLLVGT